MNNKKKIVLACLVLASVVAVVIFINLGNITLTEDMKDVVLQDVKLEYSKEDGRTYISAFVVNRGSEAFKEMYVHYNLYDENTNLVGKAIASVLRLGPHKTKEATASYRGAAYGCLLDKIKGNKIYTSKTDRTFRWDNGRLIVNRGKIEIVFALEKTNPIEGLFKDMGLEIDLRPPEDFASAYLHCVPEKYAKTELFLTEQETRHEKIIYLIADRADVAGKISEVYFEKSIHPEKCKFYKLVYRPLRLESIKENGKPTDWRLSIPWEYVYLEDIQLVYKDVDWN